MEKIYSYSSNVSFARRLDNEPSRRDSVTGLTSEDLRESLYADVVVAADTIKMRK
jgi:hypothetical protein